MTLSHQFRSGLATLNVGSSTAKRHVGMAAVKKSSGEKPAVGKGIALVRQSVNLPRQIRSRVATFGACKSKRASPPTRISPNQDSTQNAATGRVALGPWNGPFATHPNATEEPALPSLIYLDEKGVCHFGMKEHKLKAEDDRNGKSLPSPGLTLGSKDLKQQTQALVLRQHSFAARAPPVTPKGSRAVKRTHMINQPRRFN